MRSSTGSLIDRPKVFPAPDDNPPMKDPSRFDPEKVHRLREAIRDGRLRTDAGRIADAVLAEARESYSGPRAGEDDIGAWLRRVQ